MDKKINLIFYTLALIVGVSLQAELPFYQAKVWFKMDTFEYVMTIIEQSLDTKMKRHVMGDVLVSVSLLFFDGLAYTVLTLKNDYDNGD